MFRCGRLIAVPLYAVTLVACSVIPGGGSEGHVERNTMTRQQAIARVEQIIRATAVKPTPRLERYPSVVEEASCVDPTDGGSPDRAVISRIYWLRGVQPGRNADAIRQIKAYWDSIGVKYSSEVSLDASDPKITGYTQPDEFLVSLSSNADSEIYIGTTSPCIWPHGTPKPASP
jgi:hypothetical protein